MSKGLGSLQRQIIKIGAATKTVWDCGVPLPVRVAHDEEKEACGLRVTPRAGTTWRKDRKPWFECETEIDSPERLAELRANFRDVSLFKPWSYAPKPKFQAMAEAILPACISMQHIRSVLWPHLWNKDIENKPRPDSLNRWMPQVPKDIARGRNVVNASLSRAVTSMTKRGLVEWYSFNNRDCPAVMDRWQHYNRGKRGSFEWHNVLLVIDERAICRPSPVC